MRNIKFSGWFMVHQHLFAQCRFYFFYQLVQAMGLHASKIEGVIGGIEYKVFRSFKRSRQIPNIEIIPHNFTISKYGNWGLCQSFVNKNCDDALMMKRVLPWSIRHRWA